MANKNIGLIGVGNMGGAILGGIIKTELFEKDSIYLYDSDFKKTKAFENQGIMTMRDEICLVDTCDIILLCVKPQMFTELCGKISSAVTPDKIIVTIAAGISIEYLKSKLGSDRKIIRVMPNTPLMLESGASAISCDDITSEDEKKIIFEIFKALGAVEFIDEGKMNEIIAVNGSSPAFFYEIADIMASYAESKGIDYQMALNLVCATMIGSAKMMLESGKSPSSLVEMVCSPGGTTISAMNKLREGKIDKILLDTMESCTQRAYELQKNII